jgi:hypothetical protein
MRCRADDGYLFTRFELRKTRYHLSDISDRFLSAPLPHSPAVTGTEPKISSSKVILGSFNKSKILVFVVEEVPVSHLVSNGHS